METNNLTAPIAVEKDRNTLTIELMNRMKLHGMAAAFTESLTSTMAETMTIDSFLHMLLAREWDYRANAAIQRLIRGAAFRYKACLEQIDYAIPRGLDRNQMERLASLEFIRKGQNLFITGSSGTGKSFLATAMGYEACKKGIRTYYANAPKLMGTLKVVYCLVRLLLCHQNSSSSLTSSLVVMKLNAANATASTVTAMISTPKYTASAKPMK